MVNAHLEPMLWDMERLYNGGLETEVGGRAGVTDDSVKTRLVREAVNAQRFPFSIIDLQYGGIVEQSTAYLRDLGVELGRHARNVSDLVRSESIYDLVAMAIGVSIGGIMGAKEGDAIAGSVFGLIVGLFVGKTATYIAERVRNAKERRKLRGLYAGRINRIADSWEPPAWKRIFQEYLASRDTSVVQAQKI